MKQETLLPEAGSPEAMALLGRCRAIGTATWSDALDRLGIEGVIIDGACRDIDDIREGGLWVASRQVTPRTGKRRMRLGGFGEPVLLAGHTVHAGDLVVGDASGPALGDAARAASCGVHPVGLHAHPGLRRPSRRGSPWRTDRA